MKKILYTLTMLLSLGSTLCIEKAAADNLFFSIHNDTDWYAFQQAVANAAGNYRVDARLEADFSTSGGIGIGEDTPYCGTFDGNGHTITANNIWRNDGKPCALFCYVKDATITDLHVKGTISGGNHSGGLIGKVIGSSTVSIDRVWVSTQVTSNDRYAGGVIGHSDVGYVYMNDCRFDGKVITNNASQDSYSGQIIGWANNGGLWRLKRVYDCGLGPEAYWKFVCMWHNGSDWQSWGTGGGSYVVTQHGWTNADAWDKTNQQEVVNLMNNRQAGSWQIVDGKAVPKIYTKSSVNDLIYLSEGSSSGYLLSSGHYYVTQNITFSNGDGARGPSGLTIADGATVHIYVPSGVTLTANGGNAQGMVGGGPGILLPQNSTLYLQGKGKVVAQGGNAANGQNGDAGTNAGYKYDSWTRVGAGGAGGNGGGGAGAGIGTRGGNGGAGGSGGSGYDYTDWKVHTGSSGSSGTNGQTAAAMGTLYVDNSVNLSANGGDAGTSAGSGGQRGRAAADDDVSNNYSMSGGGGGGGGGFGGGAFAIGTGGCGGGGGGGGAGGSQDWCGSDINQVESPAGTGGQSGDGSTYGGSGSDGNLDSWAMDHGWVDQNGGWDSDDVDPRTVSPGSSGSGGDRGNVSDGMAVANLHQYILNLNVLNQAGNSTAQKTVTIKYLSNKSNGNVTVTIPTTYQLGLTEPDKYVTKWYTNNNCTDEWKAAYDEKSIGCGTTDLYGVWQNYSDLFSRGDGTQGNPFMIDDDELLDFANYVNDGGNTRGLYFRQNGEIDLSVIQPSGGWTPIGHKRVFEGDYDGGGYRIIKATNTSCNYDAFGIFGKVSGSIHNLGVESCDLQTTRANSRGGAIAGMLVRCDLEQATTAQIRDCYAANNTVKADYAGGLVGAMTNAASMSHCMETRSTLYGNFGGLAGLIGNDCQVDRCFTSGRYAYNGYSQQTNSECNIADSRMKSGAVTWLLNDESPYGAAWFQTLDADDYPVLNNQRGRVYYNAGSYTNTGNGPLFENLEGLGTAEKPFLIRTYDDFKVMADFCNSGNNTSGFHFLQTADFDLANMDFIVVGNYHHFYGIYDGGGHTIRNISKESNGPLGVFGYVRGKVTRLCVENSTFTGQNNGAVIGAIAGRLLGEGEVSNCFVRNCTVTGKTGASSTVAGALIGDLIDQSAIRNCLAYANTVSASSGAGHLCGYISSGTTVTRCYTSANPTFGGNGGANTNKAEQVDEQTLESGEICWSLNNETESLTPVWYQNVTIEGHNDATPLLSSDHAIVFNNNGYTNDYRGIKNLADANSQQPAGSEQNPYRVGSAADLKKISDTFETMRWSNFHVRQTADIDMKEAEPIAPIGVGTSGFTGHYDGGGFAIKNLSITESKGTSLGLFNNIVGTVERLGIENSTFRAKDDINRVGAFAGKITGSGQLLNCYVTGSTISYNYKGGVVVGALVGELVDQASILRSYGYLNTVIGQNDSGSKRYGYIVGDIGSNASATLVFTNGSALCADGQGGYDNITRSEANVDEQRFKTGEVAHLLDGSPEYDGSQGSGTSVWRQNINKTPDSQTDLVPVLKSDHASVYKMSYGTQVMYSNDYQIPEFSTLTLNPNYKDNQGVDVASEVVQVFPASNKYYVPGYHLEYSVPSRNYFYFAGWNTQADGKGTHYAPDDEVLPFTGAKTLYAEWDMTVPSNGYALEVTLPENRSAFKIYDAAGNSTHYGTNYSGTLTLKAPENHIIVLTGTVSTEALNGGQACDYMTVRNGGSSTSPVMSNGQTANVTIDANEVPVFVSTTNGTEKSIGRLVSTGREMTIGFYSDGQNNFAGLNLTATVIESGIGNLGQGTAENPFEVEFAEDLETIRSYFQEAQRTDFYIKQIEDIDLNGTVLAPLAEGTAFAGHYDGQGYTIKNGTITSNGDKLGLFASVTGSVTRLCMEDVNVDLKDMGRAGTIVGHLTGSGSITNCRVKNVTVTKNHTNVSYLGAIVGGMDEGTTITNCLALNTDNAICGNTTLGDAEHCYKVTATDDFDLLRGKICYLLNNGVANDNAVWRQEIGTDNAPVVNGEAHSESPIVYYYDEQDHQGYTNEEEASLVTLRVQDVPFNTFTDHQAWKGSMVKLTDYTPVHDNLHLVKWNTDANGTGTQYEPDGTLMLSEETVVLYPQWNIMPMMVTGDGTEQNPYIIASTDDWDALASNITYFNVTFQGYKDKYIRLDADIEVTKIMGTMSATATQGNAFCGTFDGNNHTLTATITDTGHQGTAPFCYINGATIKNLNVNSTIAAGEMQHAAALVGFAGGNSRIENCKVTGTVTGGTHIGGILAHSLNSNVTVNRCIFSGQMSGGATAKGAIVGWGDQGSITVTNCIYLVADGQATTGLDVVKVNNSYGGNISVTNTYKTTGEGNYGTWASEQINAGEIREELFTLQGYTMYGINAYTVSGVSEAYDLRTTDPVGTAVITPAVTTTYSNSAPLTLGTNFTATLDGVTVTEFPINIDEVGDYELVFAGIGSYVGSKTYHIHVIGDHVLITMAQEVGTYSSDVDLNFTGNNLKAYIAAGYNKGENQVLLVRVYDVPAGTGIFLGGEAGETYNIPKSASQSYYVNMLKANLAAGAIAQTEGSMSNFLLAKVDGVFKFCKPSATATLGANKAYLQVPTSFVSTSNAREIDIIFEDDVTGISDVSHLNMGDHKFYDLQGRLVYGPSSSENGHLKKGLYIVNGRKVVIK